MLFCTEGILIWAIPPLSPQQSDLRDFLNNNSTHTPPLLKIPFPEDTIRHIPVVGWMPVDFWYFDLWAFDILYEDSILVRYKIILKPDLSDGSFHVINMSEFISDDMRNSQRVCKYRICEDALVYFWNNRKMTWGAYAGSKSVPFKFTNVATRSKGYIDSLCPASGRYVCRIFDGVGSIGKSIFVVDLF